MHRFLVILKLDLHYVLLFYTIWMDFEINLTRIIQAERW